jgi:hypothetical protein
MLWNSMYMDAEGSGRHDYIVGKAAALCATARIGANNPVLWGTCTPQSRHTVVANCAAQCGCATR